MPLSKIGKFIAFAGLALTTSTGPLLAQSPYGMERARAVGELTHEGIAQALRDEGRVSMSGGFFEFDKADLTGTSSQVLFKIAKAMESIPELRLVIVGHTDSTGDFNYNLDLSKRRAESVYKYLESKGVNMSGRFTTTGYGKSDPVASNATEEGRAKNRRVVLRRTDCK